MANAFWRAMSMQYGADEARRTGLALREARPHLRLISDGETLIETPSYEEMSFRQDAWRELARRAVEPNPFLEPEFTLSAILHSPPASRPDIVFVWQGAGFNPRGRLIAVMAIEPAGLGLFGLSTRVGRSWRYRHSALGTPLIDRFAAARALDALLLWSDERRSKRRALLLQPIERSGAFFELLVDRCAANGFAWSAIAEYERAILLPGQTGAQILSRARSTKHRRELARLRRRLQERGSLTAGSATTPTEIREAVERFLALEHKGWKGRRRTDFLSSAGDSAFLRTMSRRLAAEGRCRIDWLAVDGEPIAMAFLLKSGDRAYFWKTAYDEAYAQFSPGVQLVLELIERQLADPTIGATDSCAIANHPMIDRLWPDRLDMVEVMVATEPGRLPFYARRERLRRAIGDAIKTVARAALGRKPS